MAAGGSKPDIAPEGTALAVSASGWIRSFCVMAAGAWRDR